MHGLIFFYIQKFAESLTLGQTGQSRLRTTVTVAGKTSLPSRGYPDEEAVALLANIAEAELLAGRLPFEGPSLISMLAAIGSGRPRPLGEAAPDVPADVADLVMRLLAHDPAERPADAAAVAAEIAVLERRLAE